MARKYLRKSEFRYYTNPKYLSKNGVPHPAYITAKYNKRYKFNVITHSKHFFNSDTKELERNPNHNRDKPKDERQSRISVSHWDKENYFSKDKLEYWRFTNKDKATVKKWNRKGK